MKIRISNCINRKSRTPGRESRAVGNSFIQRSRKKKGTINTNLNNKGVYTIQLSKLESDCDKINKENVNSIAIAILKKYMKQIDDLPDRSSKEKEEKINFKRKILGDIRNEIRKARRILENEKIDDPSAKFDRSTLNYIYKCVDELKKEIKREEDDYDDFTRIETLGEKISNKKSSQTYTDLKISTEIY